MNTKNKFFFPFFHLNRKNVKLEATPTTTVLTEETKKEFDNGEELAAIAMAIHLCMNANRDEESEILTFNTMAPRYAPWAQKSLVMKKVVRK